MMNECMKNTNSYSADDVESIFKSIDFKEFLKNAADANNHTAHLPTIQQCKKLLSITKNPPIDRIINTGILPILVQFLTRNDNPTLQHESAWILTNITAGTSEQTSKVVDAGAVPVLLELLKSPHQNVCKQALWTIGNIIATGPVLRDFVIELGLVKELLSFVKPNISVQFLRDIAWVISNLCRSKVRAPAVEVIQEILPCLSTLIMSYTYDTDILTDVVWAIVYLTDGGIDQIQMVIDSGIVSKVVPLLSHKQAKVQNGAIRAIGNIVSVTDEQTQVVLDSGALSYFPALLSHQEENICISATWFLSNILAGSEQQIQEVIDADLLPKIVEKLANGQSKTQREAVWLVFNLSIKGNKQQVLTLINYGVIPPFCKLLSCRDTEVINVVLDSLLNILEKIGEEAVDMAYRIEECGGYDMIEELQNHDNIEICKKACNIIDQQCGTDVPTEEEDGGVKNE